MEIENKGLNANPALGDATGMMNSVCEVGGSALGMPVLLKAGVQRGKLNEAVWRCKLSLKYPMKL